MKTWCYYSTVAQESIISTPEATLTAETEDLFRVDSVVEKYTELYAELMRLARKQVERKLTPQQIFENAQFGLQSFIQIIKERIDFITDSINRNPNSWERKDQRYAYRYNGPLSMRGNPIVLEKGNSYQDVWDDGIETLIFENDGLGAALSLRAEVLDNGGIRYEFRGKQLTPNPNVALEISFKVEKGTDSVHFECSKQFGPVNERDFVIPPFFEDSFLLYIKRPEDGSISTQTKSLPDVF